MKINPNEIALITTIEGDLADINTRKQGYIRYYEKEAIYCFSQWRKNGGWLKDISIYCICLTQSTVSDETKDHFKKLNVTYIEDFHPETNDYLNGYWNIPLSGKYFEENLKETIFIKTDLDMYLIKPLDKKLFPSSRVNENLTTVGRYDEVSAKHNANKLTFPTPYGRPFDTGFIISSKASRFYLRFYNKLKELTKHFNDGTLTKKYGIIINSHDNDNNLDYGVIEEFAISLMHYENPSSILGIEKYNLGEFYASIDDYTDPEVLGIYFFHEHIPFNETGYDKIRTRIDYTKRLSGIEKTGIDNSNRV